MSMSGWWSAASAAAAIDAINEAAASNEPARNVVSIELTMNRHSGRSDWAWNCEAVIGWGFAMTDIVRHRGPARRHHAAASLGRLPSAVVGPGRVAGRQHDDDDRAAIPSVPSDPLEPGGRAARRGPAHTDAA